MSVSKERARVSIKQMNDRWVRLYRDTRSGIRNRNLFRLNIYVCRKLETVIELKRESVVRKRACHTIPQSTSHIWLW